MEIFKYIGEGLTSIWAIWLFGLLASYRLIAPAQEFVSEQGLSWISQRLRERRFSGLARRFSVGFKRYVDRVFGARQRRIGRCRVWTLRLLYCAFVSFLTYLAIFWLTVAAIDTEVLFEGLRAQFEGASGDAVTRELEEMASRPGARNALLYGSLAVMSLGFGLLNVPIDYISFIETRNVLAHMGRGLWRDLLLIPLDLALTSMIAFCGMVGGLFILNMLGGALGEVAGSLNALGDSARIVYGSVRNAISFAGGAELGLTPIDVTAQSMTLSTYATSIWIWVFFSGAMLLRLAILLKPVMDGIVFMVDIDKHPFRAIWLVFALGWSVVLGLIALLG